MTIEEFKKLKSLNIMVITLSDRAYNGEYEDLSGPEIENTLFEYLFKQKWSFTTSQATIPDDPERLEKLLIEEKWKKTDIIVTTGGTGIGPKDYTPDVARKLIDKEIPGIMENIRVKYGQINANALLSRSVAGMMGQSQLYCIPGSLKAVKDYMVEIIKTLEHLIFMIHGVDVHEKH